MYQKPKKINPTIHNFNPFMKINEIIVALRYVLNNDFSYICSHKKMINKKILISIIFLKLL